MQRKKTHLEQRGPAAADHAARILVDFGCGLLEALRQLLGDALGDFTQLPQSPISLQRSVFMRTVREARASDCCVLYGYNGRFGVQLP